MASQQGAPSRPWFRLATMARPPPPAADQPPAPPQPIVRPPFIRPAFTQPLPKESMPLQQSASSSPQPSTATINRATISSPPKTVKPLEKKSPPPSPDIKPLSHPPSPLALPSPQLKSYDPPQYDQKVVLVQEKPKTSFNNGDLHRHKNGPKKPQASKNHPDSEDLGMTIITISGENKGAIMELTPFGNNKTHNSLHMKRDNNPTASSDDGDKSGTNSDGKSKVKKKNQKSPLMSTAVMNSNVQAVNNSILYNCSTTHHDPGIHLSLSRNPTAGRAFLHKDQMN